MHHVPLIIRGKLIPDAGVEFGGRSGGTAFSTADVSKYLDQLPLRSPSAMGDLYAISFDDILDFLSELQKALILDNNPHLQAALALSKETSGLTEDILHRTYEIMHVSFSPDDARGMAEASVGIPFLEGWVTTRKANGCHETARAFGARAVHIVAGNSPFVTSMSFVRNIVSRSDGIFKTPSNDPLTASAVARTMIDIAPDHPITKHTSVAYWKGGEAKIEDQIYRPQYIEKIIAWGGLASVKHITKYIEPGIDLITLDPKISSSIIGKDTFKNESLMLDAAERLAHDIGYNNQENCSNSRVVYVQTGTDSDGIEKANAFGKMVFSAMQEFPKEMSGPAKSLDTELREELAGMAYTEDYKIVAGGGVEGAIIVSQLDEPVEFAHLLNNRVANLVPIDDLDTAIRATTSYTQTVGVYPISLADEIREQLALHGAQRIVDLGYSGGYAIPGIQDGIEPLRRMCRWIIRESSSPDERPLLAHFINNNSAAKKTVQN